MSAFGPTSAPVASCGVLGFPEASSSYNFIYSRFASGYGRRGPSTQCPAPTTSPAWRPARCLVFRGASAPLSTNTRASLKIFRIVRAKRWMAIGCVPYCPLPSAATHSVTRIPAGQYRSLGHTLHYGAARFEGNCNALAKTVGQSWRRPRAGPTPQQTKHLIQGAFRRHRLRAENLGGVAS